ncbi:MAG TPA: chromosome segregation protein SMC [Thiotrichaceae bacterium]|nr:chromosome segregation protein SMC [Thiotrichaceae bacterium]
MKIESIRLKNFRMFRDVTIDKLPNCCFFVGANGTGKSSLFDLFGFLRDALTYNVKEALAKRGGFKEVVSRGTVGPIELELKFRDLKATSSKVTYSLVIDLVENMPVVKREVLKYRPKQRGGSPRHFIDFTQGKGTVVINDKSQEQQLLSKANLALKGVGQFQQFEVASELCRFIENWHLSDLQISEARKINLANGYDEHLSRCGDNMPLFAQWMCNNYPDQYHEIMHQMAYRLPNISHVEPILTEDGRIALKFHHRTFEETFQSWQVSDGTIQMFAYFLLLYDPNPHPLLCVEEPNNYLYPDTLIILAEELTWYACRGDGQVFVSTHSPDLLNGAKLEGIFWLTQKNGYTQVRTTAEDQLMKKLIEVGDLPGALWKQGFFEDAHP